MKCEGHDRDVADYRRPRRRREICRSFTCISPSFIFWRWFNGGKSRVPRTKFAERNWGKGEIDADLDVQREIGVVSPSTEDFSEIGKEATFNLGVGYGLIYLVRIELRKMAELRERIESLLQHFQTEIENQGDDHLHMRSASSICSSLTNNHVQEILYAEEHNSVQCSSPNDVNQPEIGFRCDQFRRQGSSSRMDQLEAELEAELGRLHLPEKGEFSYPELNEEQNGAELSLNMCREEHEFSRDEFHGVSPRDLERKLYQVLEVRQQEKINELESALDYAVQQLEEKETEVLMWRDAARLVAQHLPAFAAMSAQV
ncbi:protein POLAR LOCALIZATION DURING ASYMMETRIC DIVISION AND REDISTRIBUTION-like [Salvia miltiorrhiza]|uniref:protein POLAR LOCALIZATION DURING ASYMMETRIC DIVISION AND REDISTRIBUTION-like n=1 Tax=Salvia miltiorrhiza TaxID=226208 RepID=UPI0025ABD61A|nr:protein POLAR LOCALIZATION DURING ASYMMETRIC DIVISION AND REDISTRIBUTION-like [Salvia miltiorrhiza]